VVVAVAVEFTVIFIIVCVDTLGFVVCIGQRPTGFQTDVTRNRIMTMTRRADGELERDVLRALWTIDRPASANDVIDAMHTDLAYTSIATVLGRLCDKGLASRERNGRSYRYEAVKSEADLTAQRLRRILDSASDRKSALAGFAQVLDPDEAAQLAALLNETT